MSISPDMPSAGKPIPQAHRYRFVQDYVGPVKDPLPKGMVGGQRFFKKGEVVIGTPYVPEMPPNSKIKMMEMVLVEARFIVPKQLVEDLGIVAPTLDPKQDLLSQAKELKRSSGFKNGAVVGLALGAGYALFKSKNLLLYSLGGVIIGGALGHIITKNKKKKV